MAETLTCDVVIVGAGPAGVAAALALKAAGVGRVVVLEREADVGGVPRHCGHSPFGMREFGRVLAGPSYARRLGEALNIAGVEVRTSSAVTAVLPDATLSIVDPSGESSVKARRVVLATGARESSRSARMLPGDRPVGIVTTGMLQHAVAIERLKPFRKPLIVGTELVSLSAVLTCRMAGIEPVAVVEEASRPTARRPLGLFPRLLGIPMLYQAQIVDIRGRGRVEAVSVRRADGSVGEFACDGVLLTGRFVPEAALLRKSALAVDPGSGGPAIDQFGRCSDPSFYAAGNLLRPVETAGWSFREGTRIGHAVAADLAGRLPAAQRSVAILRGAGIKLAVPQRIALPQAEGGAGYIQVRVTEAASGRMVLRNRHGELWARRQTTLPERRILIPTRPLLAHLDASDSVTVAMEE
jgi:NADPH-dependent 2,4-dienoyl-CoA reductase/sulfur reductase-like enzyme